MKFIYFTVLSLSLCLNTARASQEEGHKRVKMNSSLPGFFQIAGKYVPKEIIGEIIKRILPSRDAKSFLITCKQYYEYPSCIGEPYISIIRFNEGFIKNDLKKIMIFSVSLDQITPLIGNHEKVYKRAIAFLKSNFFSELRMLIGNSSVHKDLFLLLSKDEVASFKEAVLENQNVFTQNMGRNARARVIKGLARGRITTSEAIRTFWQAITTTQGLFTDDMSEKDRTRIIKALARARITTSEAIKPVAELFPNDMSGVARAMIIKALSESRITTSEAIKAVAELFPNDMSGVARAMIIKALSKSRITTPEAISAFSEAIRATATGLFANNMHEYARAWIIEALLYARLTDPEVIGDFSQAIHNTGLFTNDMGGDDRQRIIEALLYARLTDPEVIEAIAGLFTNNMGGLARAWIIRELSRTGRMVPEAIRDLRGSFFYSIDSARFFLFKTV